MNKKFGKLPPLSTLEGFEAAARLESFSLAADEVGLTQSAISHQMRLLEDHFQQKLFIRSRRTVKLTDAGQDFLKTATDALEILAHGRNRLEFYTKPGSVVIATSPALASKWLIPKYHTLPKGMDKLEPWLHTDHVDFNIENSEIDLAIWYGEEAWPNAEKKFLFHDYVTPLCKPGYLDQLGHPCKLEALTHATLLHDERPEDWQRWLSMAGLSDINPTYGYNFSDPGLLLDSAAAGHGIALGSLILANDLINDGLLEQPFQETIETKDAYYVVTNPASKTLPYIDEMREWVLDQRKQMAFFPQG